ncbi:WXG100 family type VII secretion target [Clostridium sp. HBUAS56017]|uniref:WXG100 family type VII secretion target n=1 Tax=Clostridium sp. HBUAS56017 TaxID=2571128 RepID=UPI0011778D3E|nr:WXG100 family type VII secretion target [Clostridium sp. HBUAS56017]
MGKKVELNIMVVDAVERKMGSIVNDIKNVSEKLKNCNNSLGEDWKGKSYDAFVEKFTKLDGNFEKYIDELKFLQDRLKEIKRNFVERDNELSTMFGKAIEHNNNQDNRNFV